MEHPKRKNPSLLQHPIARDYPRKENKALSLGGTSHMNLNVELDKR
jgi:hypothetical protein